MDVFSAVIRRTPARCYAAFLDVSLLPAWVPGLRRARVVRRDPEARPLEVQFEFGEVHSYSLVYAYDPQALRLEWRPGLGGRDAVTGRASFEPHPDGCLVTYAIEPGAGRDAAHVDLGHGGRLLEEFVRWMETGRGSDG
jgi:uncharacterized protein YndB with AHSA1/START domain